MGPFSYQKAGSDAIRRAEYIALPSTEGSLPTQRATAHNVKKQSIFWVKCYLFITMGGILVWMAYAVFLSLPSRAECPVAIQEKATSEATTPATTMTVTATVTSMLTSAPSSTETDISETMISGSKLDAPVLGPTENPFLLYYPALPESGNTSRIQPPHINKPIVSRPRTPLFLSFTRNNAMLLQTLHSYISSGWPASDIIIIDNSGTMNANPLSLLSTSNPFYLDYRTLREAYGVSILQTPTLLSFSQLQNFYIRTAIAMDWHYFFWSHMDIVVLPTSTQPYKSFYAQVLQVLSNATALSEIGKPWALRFFNYDFLTLVNVEAMKAIGQWDTFVPYYASDCDFYSRVYASGYDTPESIKVTAGKIFDMPSLIPEFAAKISAIYTSNGVDEKAYSALTWELEKAQRFKDADQGVHRNSWQGQQKGGQGEMWTYEAEGFERAWWMSSRAGEKVYREKWGRGDCELWKKDGWSPSEAWMKHGV
ncbi:hypothetical protein D6C84_03699 [Aureobasidium pullulans]|uniref:Nucleotide-diphospho-sugar transferase n=1 Tax=Aureobasidium pullulans TaxID=5580 RepID=A0A4S9XXB8_AURPU|nr:hypothetical protein D6C84_03699 [Aureobasidium pullulans]